jgi:hypothetical protein
MMHLIDRRLNGRNKSAVNRERFLRRYKEHVRRAVRGMIAERSIADMDKGGDVNMPTKDVSEPCFRHEKGGDWESVHPGNREFAKGDKIPRPNGAGGGGSAGEPGTADSVDEFTFTLSREEFLNIFFDDLALPRLLYNHLGAVTKQKSKRAGYVREGAPCNLSVVRTLKTALGRRIALGAPAAQQCLELARTRLARALQEGADAGAIELLEREIAELETYIGRMPFLHEIDLRYRHRISVPLPVARAVMFCLMDVSASMDENKKDLAKRFFTMLYLFLARKYEQVELVFIRHTDNAEEVDEQTFFHDTKSGGTVVYSALELMHQICGARYPASSWNVYAAQASDGDAFGADAGKSGRLLRETVLPLARYFIYVEIPDHSDKNASSLWTAYEQAGRDRDNFAMRRVTGREAIYPVFRELFRKEAA